MEDSLETWNMAKAYLMRIDQLLTTCTHCHYNKYAGNMWYYTLLSLHAELYPKMTEKEKSEAAKLMDELRNAKNSRDCNLKGGVRGDLFLKVELFLRGLLEKKGLLTPKADDPTKAYRN